MITNYHLALEEFRRNYWIDVLAKCDGEVGQAAKLSGVNRTSLYAVLRDLNVSFKATRHRGKWDE